MKYIYAAMAIVFIYLAGMSHGLYKGMHDSALVTRLSLLAGSPQNVEIWYHHLPNYTFFVGIVILLAIAALMARAAGLEKSSKNQSVR